MNRARWALLLGLTAAIGIALRVWVYRSIMGTPNADEAMTSSRSTLAFRMGTILTAYNGLHR